MYFTNMMMCLHITTFSVRASIRGIYIKANVCCSFRVMKFTESNQPVCPANCNSTCLTKRWPRRLTWKFNKKFSPSHSIASTFQCSITHIPNLITFRCDKCRGVINQNLLCKIQPTNLHFRVNEFGNFSAFWILSTTVMKSANDDDV